MRSRFDEKALQLAETPDFLHREPEAKPASWNLLISLNASNALAHDERDDEADYCYRASFGCAADRCATGEFDSVASELSTSLMSWAWRPRSLAQSCYP